jgi:hypothetical protein
MLKINYRARENMLFILIEAKHKRGPGGLAKRSLEC